MPTTKSTKAMKTKASSKKAKKGLRGVAAERTKKVGTEKAKDSFVEEVSTTPEAKSKEKAKAKSAAPIPESEPASSVTVSKKGFSVNLPLGLIQRFNRLRGELDAQFPGDRPDRGDLVQVALEELFSVLEYSGNNKEQLQAKEKCLARAMELRSQTKQAIYGGRSS